MASAQIFQVEKTVLSREEARKQFIQPFETDPQGRITGLAVSAMLLEKGAPSLVLRLPKETAQQLWDQANKQGGSDPLAFVREWMNANAQAIRQQYESSGRPASFKYTLLPFERPPLSETTPKKTEIGKTEIPRMEIGTAPISKLVTKGEVRLQPVEAPAASLTSKGTKEEPKPAARRIQAAPIKVPSLPKGVTGEGTVEKPYFVDFYKKSKTKYGTGGAELIQPLALGIGIEEKLHFRFRLSAAQLKEIEGAPLTAPLLRELRGMTNGAIERFCAERGVPYEGDVYFKAENALGQVGRELHSLVAKITDPKLKEYFGK